MNVWHDRALEEGTILSTEEKMNSDIMYGVPTEVIHGPIFGRHKML